MSVRGLESVVQNRFQAMRVVPQRLCFSAFVSFSWKEETKAFFILICEILYYEL